MRIGVLAVQGAFLEHENMLAELGCESVELRQRKDIDDIDGLILPGGESTVQGKLLRDLGMFQPLQQLIRSGLPVLATCAGLILLAQHLADDTTVHFGTMPVTVRRNAYGRQLGSFQQTVPLKGLGQFTMTFIRAPYITQAAPDVDILATIDDHIVAARWQNQTALAFHPELGTDTRLHAQWLESIKTESPLSTAV